MLKGMYFLDRIVNLLK